jgi:hypothetical protein
MAARSLECYCTIVSEAAVVAAFRGPPSLKPTRATGPVLGTKENRSSDMMVEIISIGDGRMDCHILKALCSIHMRGGGTENAICNATSSSEST